MATSKGEFSKVYPQRWAQIVLLVGFCLVLYFLNLGRWDLWNPDEPRYAEVAREMVDRGDWILMHLNGRVYGDKPPLFFWLVAISSYLFNGFSSFSARLPSALFATLTVLLTYLLGKRLFGSRAGLLSGLVLATSSEFAYLATRANIDATLTFFTTASLFCFVGWHQERERTGTGGGHFEGLKIYGLYGGMALATLAKGPIGFILPLLVILGYLTIQKDWRGIRRMKLLTGGLLFLAVVSSWYLPAVLRGGEAYLQETLFKHTVDAYAKGWTHVRPIYYYLYNFPIDFFPWTFFLPGALLYGYVHFRKREEKGKEFLFLLVWFVAIFLFFSISKGKRAIYLLPLYPATALLVGKFWEDVISHQMERILSGWVTYPLYGLIGLFCFAGLTLPLGIYTRLPSYWSYSFPVAFVMLSGGVAIYLFARRRNYNGIFLLLIAIVACGFLYIQSVIFPLVNPYKSARFLSKEITSRIQPGEKLGLYQDSGNGHFNFYTGIVPILELEKKEELIRFLQSKERVYCLLKFRDYQALKAEGEDLKIQMVQRRVLGGKEMVLISNQ